MNGTTFETVIGLEVHAQLLTHTKAFCGCPTRPGPRPNGAVCPVCLGLPGALPVPNAEMVRLAVRTGLALGCRIRPRSRFARKNYFYPDLPKGYQISQFDEPLCEGGALVLELATGPKTIGIVRVHIEEDAGKNVHEHGATLVDFDRSGVPLAEIVSAPDLRSPEEAVAYLKELRRILVYLGVCDGTMEEGSFRCDANVSVRPAGATALGVRTELKNLNSFRNVQRALEVEVARHTALVLAGGVVVQETRLFDAASGRTEPLRSKEDAHDYRYFPEPDIPELVLPGGLVEAERAALPELPRARRERFREAYGLSPYDAEVLTDRVALADYYEEAARHAGEPKKAANWVMGELLGALHRDGRDVETSPVPAAALGRMVALVEAGTISGRMAKDVFAEMMATGADPAAIAARLGGQVSDEAALRAHVQAAVDGHPAEVGRYRGGRTQLLGFFVAEVLRATGGKANPKVVSELLRAALAGDA